MVHHNRKSRWFSIYQWHRHLGIVLAVFLLALASTGFLLNHTAELKLNQTYIDNTWLLDQYGIRIPENITAFYNDGQWISQWNQAIYLNAQAVGFNQQALRGIASWNNMFIVAFSNELQLYTDKGQLIEKIQHHEFLKNIEAVGIIYNKSGLQATSYEAPSSQLGIKSQHTVYLADSELLNWRPVHNANIVNVDITWAQERELPAMLQQAIGVDYRGHQLHLERVLLDLHSGRIFGIVGTYVVDAAAVLMLLLALSGIRLWTKKSVLKKLKPKP